jgi:hypothetical protein
MKTLRPLLLIALGLAAGGLFAKEAAKPSQVEVKYFEPDNFTDVRNSDMAIAADESSLAELRHYLEWRAPFTLPAGQKLAITFTDIDLAGDFEGWRGPRWNDIRVVKPLYPARLKFSFVLTDANGAVVKTGERELKDTDLLRLPSLMPDALRFEKGLLDDWFRAEFSRHS